MKAIEVSIVRGDGTVTRLKGYSEGHMRFYAGNVEFSLSFVALDKPHHKFRITVEAIPVEDKP